eukprot:1789252-Rhodomonas_salina.2
MRQKRAKDRYRIMRSSEVRRSRAAMFRGIWRVGQYRTPRRVCVGMYRSVYIGMCRTVCWVST